MRPWAAWAVSILPVAAVDGLVSGWPAVLRVLFTSWAAPVSAAEWQGLIALAFLAHAGVAFWAPRTSGAALGALVGFGVGAASFLVLVLPGEHHVAGLFLLVTVYGLPAALAGSLAGAFLRASRRTRGAPPAG